jgi:hypothetical protein
VPSVVFFFTSFETENCYEAPSAIPNSKITTDHADNTDVSNDFVRVGLCPSVVKFLLFFPFLYLFDFFFLIDRVAVYFAVKISSKLLRLSGKNSSQQEPCSFGKTTVC